MLTSAQLDWASPLAVLLWASLSCGPACGSACSPPWTEDRRQYAMAPMTPEKPGPTCGITPSSPAGPTSFSPMTPPN